MANDGGAAPAEGATSAAAPAEGTAPAGGQDQGTLDFPGGAGGTPASGSEGGSPEGGRILGRFADRAALEADWKKQNDILRGRVGEMPDHLLREAAEARGLVQSAPEAYDFNAAVGDSGIKWKSREEAPEAFDQITSTLKDAGFTQDHLNAAMPLVQSIVQEAVREFGSSVDVGAEKTKLSQEWGAETDNRGRAVRDWAASNLPSELFYKPLGATAEGIKLLDALMRGEKGAQPIANATRQVFDPTKVDEQLREMRQSAAYKSGLHPDHQAIHERYDELLKQKQASR